jgi:hypothetical protein
MTKGVVVEVRYHSLYRRAVLVESRLVILAAPRLAFLVRAQIGGLYNYTLVRTSVPRRVHVIGSSNLEAAPACAPCTLVPSSTE